MLNDNLVNRKGGYPSRKFAISHKRSNKIIRNINLRYYVY